MCLIVTIVMLGLAIQSYMHGDMLTGSLQLFATLAFAFMLIRNIRLTHCDKNAGCNNICMLPSWITNYFNKDK
jgi:hypothetical protein